MAQAPTTPQQPAPQMPGPMDFSGYGSWKQVTTPSGGVYYQVPGTAFVYDPFMSGMRGRPVLYRNPEPDLSEREQAKQEKKDMEALAKKQASPSGQLLPVAGAVAGTVGGAYLINNLAKGPAAAKGFIPGQGVLMEDGTIKPLASAVAPGAQSIAPVAESTLPDFSMSFENGGYGFGSAGGGGGVATPELVSAESVAPEVSGLAGAMPFLGPAAVAATPLIGAQIAKYAFAHDRTPRPMVMDEVLKEGPNPFGGRARGVGELIGGDRAHQEAVAQKAHELAFLTNTGYGMREDPTKSKDPNDPWLLNVIAPRSVRPQYFEDNGGNFSKKEKDFYNKSFEDQLGEVIKNPLDYKPEYVGKAQQMLDVLRGGASSPASNNNQSPIVEAMPTGNVQPMPHTVQGIEALSPQGVGTWQGQPIVPYAQPAQDPRLLQQPMAIVPPGGGRTGGATPTQGVPVIARTSPDSPGFKNGKRLSPQEMGKALANRSNQRRR